MSASCSELALYSLDDTETLRNSFDDVNFLFNSVFDVLEATTALSLLCAALNDRMNFEFFKSSWRCLLNESLDDKFDDIEEVGELFE